MISFECDYVTGAHPEVLRKLVETNMESLSGYGCDVYSLSAAKKIKEACNCPNAEVYFLTGGTQTNQTIISTMLQSYEGVIAPETGHIATLEAGAIEFCSHKVLTLPSYKGKLKAEDIEKYLVDFNSYEPREHMVFPGMVYISFPTEYGTLYNKQELQEISKVCRKYNLPLYIDGARLGYGLASPKNDVTLEEIANLCDVFYIGGTKVGALCGEAVVFTKNNVPRHFNTQIKQHGALLAKGRVLGVQFDALFTNGLYMKLSKHAIDMAKRLKRIFKEKGYKFYVDSPTNLQFIVLENSKISELRNYISFSCWDKYDENHTVARFATSWATSDVDLEEMEKILGGFTLNTSV